MADESAIPPEELVEKLNAATGETPPATFVFHVQTLFTQALMALGRVPNPITGKPIRNLPSARHFIDTIAMLEEKTAGNLSDEETKLLEEVLHQLRMQFTLEQSGPVAPTITEPASPTEPPAEGEADGTSEGAS